MREIKFRGYAVEEMINSQWLYGFGVIDIDYVDGTEEWHLHTLNGVYEVYPESIGQYTGLKDKSGMEIYEGDVCKANFGEWNGKMDIKTFIVYWHGVYGSWAYATNKEYYKHGTKVGSPYGLPSKSIEVIGNIYENPELLEEGKHE